MFLTFTRRKTTEMEEELISVIEYYKPEAKSKLRISYNDNQIEFFKVNKHVFPVFYIIFK